MTSQLELPKIESEVSLYILGIEYQKWLSEIFKEDTIINFSSSSNTWISIHRWSEEIKEYGWISTLVNADSKIRLISQGLESTNFYIKLYLWNWYQNQIDKPLAYCSSCRDFYILDQNWQKWNNTKYINTLCRKCTCNLL